jgi:exosortase
VTDKLGANRWWNGRATQGAAGNWPGRAERVDIVALLLLAALALAYASVVRELARLWSVDPYAGHGMFVPAYSALLLWFDRRRLAAIPRTREPAGGLLVLAALALLWIGRWAGSIAIQGLSLVIAGAGATLWRFGSRRLRAAAFPIGFLAFMLPLPRTIVNAVTLPIQTFHAYFSSVVLEIAGVPHVQQGPYIELPTTTLIVAEGCNGLRFLMALLTLAAAFAQVSQRTIARKVLLVALAVPLAVLANSVRVSALCLAAYHLGPQAATGLTHYTIGKAFWGGVLVVLAAIGILLRRRDGHADGQGPRAVGSGPAGDSSLPSAAPRTR